MSGVELIVNALATGASAGVASTMGVAVQDAYRGLKDLIRQRFAGRGEAAQQALEADETQPGVWQTRIGPDLTGSGAADDEEVLAAARALLALADPQAAAKFQVDAHDAKGIQVGDYNTQTNTFN